MLAKQLLHVFLSLLVFLVIDLIWLGIVAKSIYNHYLADFLRPDVNWVSAFVFYGLFVLGLLLFAVYPALALESLAKAVLLGALYGFFTYMTYELTNSAVIKNWPSGIIAIDIIWGTALGASVAAGSYYLAQVLSIRPLINLFS